ncbi:MAG TPA: methyltransferase domain-containing protein [Tepidisphaeraceae bacterium]|nr:methyltransferase domain-containing protein [Tepidisphaeraceae bacterium]
MSDARKVTIRTQAAGWFARRRVDELMDAPELPLDQHRHALAGLRRINAASGVANQLTREIVAWARRRNLSHVRLLDVACGGGDVPVNVARSLASLGISIDLTLVDRSPNALKEAAELARVSKIKVVTQVADATRAFPEDSFDIVTNTLFLHHLDEADVITSLKDMKRAARLLLVSDLRRSPLAWGFTWIGCRLVSRSSIVHFDGPVSVRGAWTIGEMKQMAMDAGLTGATIRRQWPFRMLLRWERDE